MNKRGRLCRGALASLLVLASTAAAAAAEPGVGGYAPEFELKDAAGTPRKLVWGDHASPATIVFFFDAQSRDGILGMNLLDAFSLRGRDFGLSVYAVDARGRQPAEVTRSMERYGSVYGEPAFPVLPDPSFRVGRTYGVAGIPVTFVMEPHGVILSRIEGYDQGAAVAIARRVEQLLGRERGFFTPALRGSGISEAEEKEAEARNAAAAASPPAAPPAHALGVGDRAPDIEFTGPAGRSGRWSWGGGNAAVLRVVAFIEGFSLISISELTWLDTLSRRGRDTGLEVLAVEAGGMDAVALGAALEKYRRYNPEPSFPVVDDAGGRLAGVFGPWEKLPQTYLLAPDGSIVHRAEGFSPDEGKAMLSKVERAFALANRPFPRARDESGPAAGAGEQPPPGDEEAPSLRKKREEDERFRSSIVLGDAFFITWEFDRALPHYLAALEIEPKDFHALVRVARIQERRGDLRSALAFWERALAVQPDHAEARTRVRELQPDR